MAEYIPLDDLPKEPVNPDTPLGRPPNRRLGTPPPRRDLADDNDPFGLGEENEQEDPDDIDEGDILLGRKPSPKKSHNKIIYY